MPLAATEILTAVRDRLLNVEGPGAGERNAPKGTYVGGLHELLTPGAEAIRGFGTPAVEVVLSSVVPHQSGPFWPGLSTHYLVEITVRIVRTAVGDEALVDTRRDELRGAAADDADLLRWILTWPGNLTTTSENSETGIVSGRLSYVESVYGAITPVEEGAGYRLMSEHRFTGVARVVEPIPAPPPPAPEVTITAFAIAVSDSSGTFAVTVVDGSFAIAIDESG